MATAHPDLGEEKSNHATADDSHGETGRQPLVDADTVTDLAVDQEHHDHAECSADGDAPETSVAVMLLHTRMMP